MVTRQRQLELVHHPAQCCHCIKMKIPRWGNKNPNKTQSQSFSATLVSVKLEKNKVFVKTPISQGWIKAKILGENPRSGSAGC